MEFIIASIWKPDVCQKHAFISTNETAHMAWHKSFFLNTLRPRQNGRRFADGTFKRTFLNENIMISIEISLKFIPKGPINSIPAWVQIMTWRRPSEEKESRLMDSP